MKINNISKLIKENMEQLIPNVVIGSFQLTDDILNQIPLTLQDKLVNYKNYWIVVFSLPITDEVLWAWYSTVRDHFLFANLLLKSAEQSSIEMLRKLNVYANTLSDIVGPNISMVELGVIAGIGQKGRHKLLLHPLYGSWLQISALIVSETVLFQKENFEKICFECNRCIDACPVDALSVDAFEKYKCSNVVATPTKRKSKAKALTSNFYIECNECVSACPIGNSPEVIYEWKQI